MVVKDWIGIYQNEGISGLLPQDGNNVYNATLKMSAATDYVSGNGSLRDVCQKYKIRSSKQLRNWLEVYNGPAKKIGRGREESCLSQVRQGHIYTAIKECNTEVKCPIETACELLHAARSAYHKWATGIFSPRTSENIEIAQKVESPLS